MYNNYCVFNSNNLKSFWNIPIYKCILFTFCCILIMIIFKEHKKNYYQSYIIIVIYNI